MKITKKQLQEMVNEQVKKMLKQNQSKYMLIDYDNKEVKSIDFHGETYQIIEVLRDGVIIDDEEQSFIDIDQVKQQDDIVKKIIKRES